MTKRKWDSKKVGPDARERARRENERQRALKKDAADALSEAQTSKKKAPDARARDEMLQKMVTDAEDAGLYDKLDVTFDQIRIVELEAENAQLEAVMRLQRKKIKELKQSLRALLAHAEGTRKARATQIERARWRIEHS